MRKSETEIKNVHNNSRPQWTKVILDDYDEVTETTIKLRVKHFTLFASIGYLLGLQPAAKWVYLVAFSSHDKEENALQPTVYCANHYLDVEVIYL